MTQAEEAVAWRTAAVKEVVDRLIKDGLSRKDIGHMVSMRNEGRSVKEIAADMGVPWPRIHLAVFDLYRAGAPIPSGRRK